MQLLYHVSDLPHTNHLDGVGVDLHKDQRHGTSCAEGGVTDTSFVESGLWVVGANNRAGGRIYFVAFYYVLLPFVEDCCKGGFTGGVVVENMRHLVI